MGQQLGMLSALNRRPERTGAGAGKLGLLLRGFWERYREAACPQQRLDDERTPNGGGQCSRWLHDQRLEV